MKFFRTERNADGQMTFLCLGKLRIKMAIEPSRTVTIGKIKIRMATGPSRMPFSEGPSANIDGTPMFGSVDINGNPFGVTTKHSKW